MSVISNNQLAGAAGQGGAGQGGDYQIERSLRFNSSDSAYCSRAVSTASTRKIFTISAWVKRSGFSTGSHQAIYNADTSYTDFFGFKRFGVRTLSKIKIF